MTRILPLDSPDATADLGRAIGRLLFPGAVVALVGTLGAGKTFLSRAIAEGLGVPDPRIVTSPTFVLVNEYAGRLDVAHFDAYRLAREKDFADLGFDEMVESGVVCLVEWADRVAGVLPRDHLRVTLDVVDETRRTATLEARGGAYLRLVESLQ